MKRFWKEAAFAPAEGGYGVVLDGRPVKTPKGRPLLLPTPALAQAITAEWNAVAGEVKPGDMRLTGLANAAIDLVADDPAAFAEGLWRYAESDMLCYRAEHPDALLLRQERAWGPALGWAEEALGARFRVTAGVMHLPQPEDAVARVRERFEAQPPFALAALSSLVSLTGSALLPLALLNGVMGREAVWEAAILDEAFQAEQWGEDALAAASRAERRRQFDTAADFLAMLQPTG